MCIRDSYSALKFSPVVETVVKELKRNPKRMQREAKRQMQETGVGTKAQQALKLQQEQDKQKRKVRSREKKEAEELRKFELKQQKMCIRDRIGTMSVLAVFSLLAGGYVLVRKRKKEDI